MQPDKQPHLQGSSSLSDEEAEKHEDWIEVSHGGLLQVERNGPSATLHIRQRSPLEVVALANASPKSLSFLSQSNPTAQDKAQNIKLDLHMPNIKRSKIMPTCSVEQKAPTSLSSMMIPNLPVSVNRADQLSSLLSSALSIPFNLLHEASPLGLTLRKTPSLIDLVQKKLGQSEPQADVPLQEVRNKERKSSMMLVSQQEKLKASNFPALVLRIGTWEWVSRHEGDLVAKCYYAKRKLVWEVLENRLKSKLEIQWSDITALKASCLDNKPGVLEIEVSRPPLFFKETNPQPRKHTMWHAASDFTGGQANLCKWHYLMFPPGLLNKHYEKLMESDPRLKSLSEKSFPGGDPAYFCRPTKNIELQCGGLQRRHSMGSHPLMQIENHDNENRLSFACYETLLGSTNMQHVQFVPKPEPVEVKVKDTTNEEGSLRNPVTELHRNTEKASKRNEEYFGPVELKWGKIRANRNDHSSLQDSLLVQQHPFDAYFSDPFSIQRPASGTSPVSRKIQNPTRLYESLHDYHKEPLPPTPCHNLKAESLKTESTFTLPNVLFSSASFSSAPTSACNSLHWHNAHAEWQTSEYGIGIKPEKLLLTQSTGTSVESSVFRINRFESQEGSLDESLPNLRHMVASSPQFLEPPLHGLHVMD